MSLVHVLAFRHSPPSLSLPEGVIFSTPGCMVPRGMETAHDPNLFSDAVDRLSCFIDDVAERNRSQQAWIHSSDIFFRQHRFKLFGFFFLQSVVAGYPGQEVLLHCDDSHFALSAREVEGVTVHHYGKVHPVSRALVGRFSAATLALKTWFKSSWKVVHQYWRERKIVSRQAADGSRSTLLVTTDHATPWSGGDPTQQERIWGRLGEEIDSDYGVLMLGRPGASPHGINQRATGIELLNTFRKLIAALSFRASCLGIFLGFVLGNRCPEDYKRHLAFFTAPLFDDLLYQAPKWHSCHVAVADFLERHPQYKTLIYYGEFCGFGRSMLQAARKNKRVSLAYAHGFYYEAHLQLRFSVRELEIFARPDVYLVWSRQTLGIIKRNAAQLLPICIAGQCRLGPPAGLPPYREKRGRVGILPSTADCPSLMEFLECHSHHFQGLDFLWKPHPTRPTVDIGDGQLSLERFSGASVDQFYDKIDCLLVGCSTAGGEALQRGIPVVVVLDPVKWGANTVTVHSPDHGVYLAEGPEEVRKGCDLYMLAPSLPLERLQGEAERYLGSFSSKKILSLIRHHEGRVNARN